MGSVSCAKAGLVLVVTLLALAELSHAQLGINGL